MRIVVDTNILFSAMLNTDSQIAHILLQPKSTLNFYTSQTLAEEINEHAGKLRKIAGYSTKEFDAVLRIFTSRIRFINPILIPKAIFEASLQLTQDIDIDDTEFVALTEHIKGYLWSGDHVLRKGLERKKWKRFIQTEQLILKLEKRLRQK